MVCCSLDTSHPAPVTKLADEPDRPQGDSLPRSSAVLSGGKQSSPVVTQRQTGNQHNSHEQLLSSGVVIVTAKTPSPPRSSVSLSVFV